MAQPQVQHSSRTHTKNIFYVAKKNDLRNLNLFPSFVLNYYSLQILIMSVYFKMFFSFILLVFLTIVGYAGNLLAPEELSFIDNFIVFLEDLNIDGIHVTLTLIISTLLVVLKLFKSRFKKALDKQNE